MTTCACCGVAITDTDRVDVRLMRPDAALSLSDERLHRVTGGLLQVEGVGSFVRCLMPVRLTGDLELVLGTWLRISDADLRRLEEVWDDPAYADVVVRGTLANAIKPWDVLGAEATAVVRDVNQTPYVDGGPLVHQVWDRDDVLSCFPHELPVSVHTELTDDWAIERTAGLTAHVADRTTRFEGPGRAVTADVYGDRAGRSPEEFLGLFLDNAPAVPPEQTLTERREDLLRHALWLPGELYGFAVRQGTLLSIGCFYDDPDDLAWAKHVLRSVTYRR